MILTAVPYYRHSMQVCARSFDPDSNASFKTDKRAMGGVSVGATAAGS